MALADNAFEAPDLNTPERLYSLRVKPGPRCRPVTFKPSILGTPLFRNDAGDTLSYSSLRKQTVDLGSASCFREVLTTYGLRRGVANAINGKCSIVQQNQIMTHNDRNGTDATFQGHYQDETVRFNVQQAYTGLPSDEMLLKTSRLMSRHVDPRITEIVQLTSEEIYKLRSDKALADFKEQQGELRQQIIQEFGRMKDAEGSDLHQSHNKIRSRANYKMRALQANALDTKKKELRDFYAVDDIQRQLNGLPSTVPTVVPEPTYTHPERARIVEKLFSSKLCKVGTDADIQDQVSVLTDLVALCKLKDLPRSRASVPMDQTPKPEPSNDSASASDDSDAGLSFSSSTVATSCISSTSRLSFEHDMPRWTSPKDSPSVLQQPASSRPAYRLSVTLPFEPAIGGANHSVPCFTDLSLTDEDVVKSAETLSESSLDFGTPLDHVIRDTHFPEPAPTSDRVQTDEDVDMLCPVEADLGMNFGAFFDDVIDTCPEPSSNEVQADDILQPYFSGLLHLLVLLF